MLPEITVNISLSSPKSVILLKNKTKTVLRTTTITARGGDYKIILKKFNDLWNAKILIFSNRAQERLPPTDQMCP
jgi:hypothetical protein